MNQNRKKIGGFLLAFFFMNVSFSADDSQKDLTWLRIFFSKGIHSANAQYVNKLDAPNDKTEQFNQRSSYTVDFLFAEKKYNYSFIFEYRDFWSALTNNNTTNPPKQEVHFVGSKISPWKNLGDMGIYQEEFSKNIPNWFVFDDLDSLMIKQCWMNNPLPPITGIFYADEFKALKRIYKEAQANSKAAGIWSYFEFDAAGNVVGISPTYLYTLSETNLIDSKNFESYSILLRNNDDESIFIDILTSDKKPLLLEGISIRQDERKINIFNFEINSLMHKFVPELIFDPRDLIQEYLKELQKESDKALIRFETTENK